MTQLTQLKSKLLEIIDEEKDSLRIYRLGHDSDKHIEVLGKSTGIDVTGILDF